VQGRCLSIPEVATEPRPGSEMAALETWSIKGVFSRAESEVTDSSG
jgi:hypothetical protein